MEVILLGYSWYPMIRVPDAGLNPMRGLENRTSVSSPLELWVGFHPRLSRYCSISFLIHFVGEERDVREPNFSEQRSFSPISKRFDGFLNDSGFHFPALF